MSSRKNEVKLEVVPPPRNVACSVAGITSDANILTSHLRGMAQQYRYRYQEPMPCEQLVMRLCDYKQAYTQFGGKLSHSRPPSLRNP